MNEDEVDERLGRGVEEVQSVGTSRIIHAIIDEAGGPERAGGRQFGVFAPKSQKRLFKT